MLATSSIWALILGLVFTTADPRIDLVDLQLGRDPEAALAAVERALDESPERARALGLDYLRGHLLLQLDRRTDALDAFVDAMASAPALAAYSRYWLAREQAELGRHDVAAGLISSVLSDGSPRALLDPALLLFQRTLDAGGDCRLLGDPGLDPARFSGLARRRLQLASASCALRQGEMARGEKLLFGLLAAKRTDDVARVAAERLLARAGDGRSALEHMLIGLALYHHRDFTPAIQHLARANARLPESNNLSRNEIFELRYALARSHFWQERYAVAAAAFGALAGQARGAEQRAQTLYQQGRCHELDDDWAQAIDVFRDAYRVNPGGEWSDSALMSQLRLLWRSERESDALTVYQTLAGHRRPATQQRALLFFASSDLVRGRVDRAEAWLAAAARLGRDNQIEIAYWQGRLAELEGDVTRAVGLYLQTLRADAYHPFAQAARERIGREPLRQTAWRVGRRLAASTRIEDLHGAWLLLGDGDDTGRGARRILEARLDDDVTARPYLRLTLQPPSSWPLWRASLRQPEEQLLALGLWDEGAPVVLRHFPVAEPPLAFTGSLLLARAGATRRSLYIAEVLQKRVPERVPVRFLPERFRQLLYPFRFSYLILRETGRHDVDPYLLAAIIREESRFDPRAFSAASARGLTQFVVPTARRMATRLGLDHFAPDDLERPAIAIAFGAAYLDELGERFDGDRAQMVAAYNAGEPQAELWRRYCFSDEPAELYSKISFRETRGYVIKVLTSWAHYRELYTGVDGVAPRGR